MAVTGHTAVIGFRGDDQPGSWPHFIQLSDLGPDGSNMDRFTHESTADRAATNCAPLAPIGNERTRLESGDIVVNDATP
jgi:hypothetical protein